MNQTEQDNLLRIQLLGHDLAATITDRLAAANLPLRSGMTVLSVAVNEIIESTGDDTHHLRQMFKKSLDVCDES